METDGTMKNKKLLNNIEKRSTKTKRCSKVENFLRQAWQGPYCICTKCYWRLYQRNGIWTQNLSHTYSRTVSSSEICYEKLYKFETCHKHSCKNYIPWQAVCKEMVKKFKE